MTPVAWHAEGGPLTFFATSMPPGTRLDAGTGRLIWRPAPDVVPAGGEPGPGLEQRVEIGVVDAAGFEARRVVRLVRSPEPGAGIDRAGGVRLVLPEDGVPWPVEQSWRVALQAEGVGAGALRFSATGRTPSDLELDADTGILSWTASHVHAGEEIPVGVRLTDGAGYTSDHTVVLRVQPGQFDVLPETLVPAGGPSRVDVAPDAPRAVCSPAGDLPAGVSLEGCTLTLPELGAVGGSRTGAATVRIRWDGLERWRTVPWRTVESSRCEASAAGGALPAAPELGALAETSVTLCDTVPGSWSHGFRVPAESRWVEAFADLPPGHGSRAKLALRCGNTDAVIHGRTGGTLAVRQRVEAAAECTLTLTSERALDTPAAVAIGLRVGTQPYCARASDTEALADGDLLVRRICPGESQRFELRRDIAAVESTLSDILVDAEWYLRSAEGPDVLVASRVGLGFGERLWPLESAELPEGSDDGVLVLRLTAWAVPWRGGELLLRAGERQGAGRAPPPVE